MVIICQQNMAGPIWICGVYSRRKNKSHRRMRFSPRERERERERELDNPDAYRCLSLSPRCEKGEGECYLGEGRQRWVKKTDSVAPIRFKARWRIIRELIASRRYLYAAVCSIVLSFFLYFLSTSFSSFPLFHKSPLIPRCV